MAPSWSAVLYVPALAAAFAFSGSSGQAAQENVQSMLAAQIRLQGSVRDKVIGAKKDTQRSRPDYAVWVLNCGNARHRVSRAPDMAAKVDPLR
ncbi:hypothetical protein CI1B_74740 [Bradyrhizobium ivorense]|uniref:Uncharacterized protein n=1 Tax=Bradyrhizobium ivorense TaxID=2511166 RepID=A0A508TWV6_9BRAD|nr:hypothetical protein CI1B_74740 [Bradyrhizobium ivorense]